MSIVSKNNVKLQHYHVGGNYLQVQKFGEGCLQSSTKSSKCVQRLTINGSHFLGSMKIIVDQHSNV